ncbi:Imm7 family immunity protein [Nocardia sp. CS682]|uniref:Imm7 family immunity protein n=1 Tax=Nocardia sp. CS682 TaxID=1047172 RepID=UPI001074F9AC|nr:Imm7 family immunity protein [Nocardia sp. CS682]QBS44844.1 hypothetical protein DMB37_36985 [Nocardia sp. CS682]
MFEYHGWLTAQHDVEYDDQARSAEVYEAVEARLAEFDTVSGLVDLRRVNGKIQLHVAGYKNHPQWNVVEAFKEIGTIAPGSYGMLWIRNDEDPDKFNEFQAIVMRRGQVSVEPDTLLSPCVPIIENEDE